MLHCKSIIRLKIWSWSFIMGLRPVNLPALFVKSPLKWVKDPKKS